MLTAGAFDKIFEVPFQPTAVCDSSEMQLHFSLSRLSEVQPHGKGHSSTSFGRQVGLNELIKTSLALQLWELLIFQVPSLLIFLVWSLLINCRPGSLAIVKLPEKKEMLIDGWGLTKC